MRVNANGLGYREIARLAEFMAEIADHGIEGDVVREFGYDMKMDEAFCTTENGRKIWANITEDMLP